MRETDAIEKLEELLSQDQFELLLPIQEERLRLVYLMNDAVESFLIFEQVRMTGEYNKDYEGELGYSLSRENEEYVLVVYQGNQVVTLFFKNICVEADLYDYGSIGHFWVKKWEDLRQIEYRLAILRDKYVYLGNSFCTPEEERLALLADFPPLNYCCYPSVPEKYLVTRENAWDLSGEAVTYARKLAMEAGDRILVLALDWYRKHPGRATGRIVGRMLRRNVHTDFVELIGQKLKAAASVYPSRFFGKKLDTRMNVWMKKAAYESAKQKNPKRKIEILRQEPFVLAQDSIEPEVYLLISEKGFINRKIKVCPVTEDME